MNEPNFLPEPRQNQGDGVLRNPWIPVSSAEIVPSVAAAPAVPAGPSVLLRQRRRLRRLSKAGGCALLLPCILNLLLGFPLGWLHTYITEDREILWFCFLRLLAEAILMGGALLGLAMLRPEEHNLALNFEQPFRGVQKHDTLRMASVILVGIALCQGASWLWELALGLLRGWTGAEFQAPPGAAPENLPGFVLALVAVAIAPAFVEETFLRGMILQPLRRFGNGFAVVCSALLFGLLHQSAAQAPLAFLSGLVLGWAAVYSESLWLPIMIHFWHSAVSVMLSAVGAQSGAAARVLLSNGYTIVVGALGLIGAAALFLLRRRGPSGPKPRVLIPVPARAARYLLGSVPMVLAVAYLCLMIALDARR